MMGDLPWEFGGGDEEMMGDLPWESCGGRRKKDG